MWGIAELGLDYERLDYGHDFGGLDTPEFRALSPHALVPVVQIDDLAMFESCAILRYLADRFGDTPFWPKDQNERAVVDMWAEWGKTSVCTAFTGPIFWARVRTAAVDRDKAALVAAIKVFESRLDILEGQLEQFDYVVGETLTLADIVVGHILYRWFDVDVPRKSRPLVEAFYARLQQRPAFRDHVMVPYDVLRAEGA